MGRGVRKSGSKNQKKANEENKESTTNRVETSEKIVLRNDEENVGNAQVVNNSKAVSQNEANRNVLFDETAIRNDEKFVEGNQAIVSSFVSNPNDKDHNVINEDNEDRVTKTYDTSDNDFLSDEEDDDDMLLCNALVTMSQSSYGNLREGEENEECNDQLKEKIKFVCQVAIDKIEITEKRANTQGKEIARILATQLIKNSSAKLYTLETRTRSKKSFEDKSVSVDNILFIKASPCLLLAYSEMEQLWKNGNTQRNDTSFKIFTRNVFNALVKLDDRLEPVENFTLRKVHKSEMKDDQNLLYWLEPKEVAANSLELTTSSKKRKTSATDDIDELETSTSSKERDLTSSSGNIIRKSSRCIGNAEKPKVTVFENENIKKKRTKSKPNKKKMVAAKMKVLFQEALNCGIKIDTVQTMWNEVVTVEDDTVLETDGSDNEEEGETEDEERGRKTKGEAEKKDDNVNRADRSETGNKVVVVETNLAKKIANVITSSFSFQMEHIKLPKVMYEIIDEYLDDSLILKYEKKITSNGTESCTGIHQILYTSRSGTDDVKVHCLFKDIGSCLNMSVSDRIGFVVTPKANEEVFVNTPDENCYTLLVGYMPNTTVKILEKVGDIHVEEEIQFDKGDLIILKDCVRYTFGNVKYEANKVFEVVYLFFDAKKK